MTRNCSSVLVLGLVCLAGSTGVAWPQAIGEDLVYTAIQPCRMVDTRFSTAGILIAGAERTINIVGANTNYEDQGGNSAGCQVPGFTSGQPQVQAVFVNLVAINPAGPGNIKGWATGTPEPNASMLNYQALSPNLNIANGVAVPVRQDQQGSDFTVKAGISNTHLVIDVVGYFTRSFRGGAVRLGAEEGTSGIYFFDGGSPTGRSLRWNEAQSMFEVNGPLRVTALSQGSSVALKTDFRLVDPTAILEALANLPISTWRYKEESGGKHLGPTAEDFYRSFELGRGDGTITAVDADGVALASIQALYQLLLEREALIEDLRNRLDAVERNQAACSKE